MEKSEKLKVIENIEVKGISYDSRLVKPGWLFVALKGDNFDGHSFLEQAKQKGAIAAICNLSTGSDGQSVISNPRLPIIAVEDSRTMLADLAQKFYGNPSNDLKIIGVTGTYGKTTSTWLLKSIYEAQGLQTGLIGTIKYEIGDNSVSAHHTTPESLDLQRIFYELREQGIKVCIMEVSSHGLALERVRGVDFDIAALTGLGRDHLDFHHTLKEYENTKLKLFSDLKPDALAVLNQDDHTFNRFKKYTKAKVISYGTSSPQVADSFQDSANKCNVCGKLCSSTQEGIEVLIRWDGRKEKISSKLVGGYNLYNVLLAATCALKDGASFEVIREGIEKMEQVPGRFERVGRVIVDYAHTPEALKSALKSTRELAKGRIICVFGCGGDRDQGKRPLMGKIASELADYVILTTDNPRSEDPLQIIEDIIQGVTVGNYEIVLDREQAIRTAIERSSEEDIILLVGKGHENYQIYGELKIPWDDREVAREIQNNSPQSQGDAKDTKNKAHVV